jgi:cytochrome c oxidase subunit II
MTPRNRVWLLVALAVFAAVSLVLPLTFGLPEGGSPPGSATASGDAINDVYWVVLAMSAVVFLAVETTLIVFIFRFARRPETPLDAEGPQIHGNTRLEIIWTLIPAVALLGLAIFTFLKVPDVQEAGATRDLLRIRVEAHQFYWQYEYPNGALSFDTLYLPAGRTVELELRSRDVDHSWWVPELTGKRDAIPGEVNTLRFTPRRPGTFENGVCGEFCGIQHAFMTTDVEVMSRGEFEAWLDENVPQAADAVALGQSEWEAACAKCHGIEGEGDIGPAIAGNPTLTDAESLRDLLYEGQNTDTEGYMPPVGRGWSDRQIDALIAYVESKPTLVEGRANGG